MIFENQINMIAILGLLLLLFMFTPTTHVIPLISTYHPSTSLYLRTTILMSISYNSNS